MDLALKEKVAIVTGGSRGLGRAICASLAAEGAHVAINYNRSRQPAEQLADELRREHGVEAVAIGGDVSDAAVVTQLFDQAEYELGNCDILINNAGIWPKSFVADLPEEDWDRTFQVNLKGAFLSCREAVRRWLDRKCLGRIVNVSSAVAFMGSTSGHAHYAASKAGLVNFTVSLAREMGSYGICVNAVAPGMMRTDMAADALQAREDEYLARIPLRRIAEPEEVADVVLFLASARASYLTGATVDVSGGMLMR
jgi:3-oxoacyl-[acyl-carrier protein] reductase